ncbi:hypothetical protein BCL69_10709 [Nitrosomonas communis]|uniref:Uncharacterized protein n=1 Tax=Nitrosomonas communis TaxID=44574 RepID=A0A5D3Y844_9PROT|nr:hypothetical protein BCL69_10709 [Nitrosomonas communis]
MAFGQITLETVEIFSSKGLGLCRLDCQTGQMAIILAISLPHGRFDFRFFIRRHELS